MEIIIFAIFVTTLMGKLNRQLIVENLVLRQQPAIMRQSIKRPRIRKIDRLFWILLSRFLKGWQDELIVVKPETVISWNRKGFKLYWTHKSRKRVLGRLPIDPEIRKLIINKAKANPLWGAPRIHGKLQKLGITVSERTVSNIIKKHRTTKPPSQSWEHF